jgi:polyisoprenoid-binding protein YceI
MKKLLSIIFLLNSVIGLAQTKQTVTRATITYQVKNMGFNTSGNFSGFDGAIAFDKDKLASSVIEASVDSKSINTDNDMRDNHLKKEEYFDVDHYPKITMKSVSFKHKSGNNFTGTFNLTIKGITKPVDVPFTYVQTGNSSVFKGSFKINRLDFKVGDSSMTLSDSVIVNVEVDASTQP